MPTHRQTARMKSTWRKNAAESYTRWLESVDVNEDADPEEYCALISCSVMESILVQKISGALEQDPRSVAIEIVNVTSRTLTKVTDNFHHGGKEETLPKIPIGPFSVDAGRQTGFAGGAKRRQLFFRQFNGRCPAG